MSAGDFRIRAGDTITVDGTTGEVLLGAIPMVRPEPPPAVALLLGWARELGLSD